jgi:hypothetical protein
LKEAGGLRSEVRSLPPVVCVLTDNDSKAACEDTDRGIVIIPFVNVALPQDLTVKPFYYKG